MWLRVLVVLVIAGGCGRKSDDHTGYTAALASCSSKGDLACPRPIITVGKLDASIRYYRDKLGFAFDWHDGEPPDFASVTRGGFQLFMCERCQGHPGSWIWVPAKDVDVLYTELAKRGAIILAKPENKPWGVREMQVADPDGNVLRFASKPR